jgi:hypothetical protein
MDEEDIPYDPCKDCENNGKPHVCHIKGCPQLSPEILDTFE